MREQLEDERRRDLVRDVGDAQVEEGQLELHEVGVVELELVRQLRALHALLQLDHHPRVVLDRDDALRRLEQLERQVARARAHLEHDVRCAERRLLDHRLRHQRVLQQVLQQVCSAVDLPARAVGRRDPTATAVPRPRVRRRRVPRLLLEDLGMTDARAWTAGTAAHAWREWRKTRTGRRHGIPACDLAMLPKSPRLRQLARRRRPGRAKYGAAAIKIPEAAAAILLRCGGSSGWRRTIWAALHLNTLREPSRPSKTSDKAAMQRARPAGHLHP